MRTRPGTPTWLRICLAVRRNRRGCWIWTRALDGSGYGIIRHHRRTRSAHRVSYEAFVGPIPAGLELDHTCRTQACVNPWHLEPVDNAENIRRRVVAKTHCPSGHPYDDQNTYWLDGVRRCRACNRIASARSKARRRSVLR